MTARSSILVVDHQPYILDSLAQTLRAEGLHVFTASDGLEALMILQRSPIHLIVSDIALPRMNGWQLCKHVRADQRWKTTPFLFLSNFEPEYSLCHEQLRAVDAYLTRPIQPEELVATIYQFLPRAPDLA